MISYWYKYLSMLNKSSSKGWPKNMIPLILFLITIWWRWWCLYMKWKVKVVIIVESFVRKSYRNLNQKLVTCSEKQDGTREWKLCETHTNEWIPLLMNRKGLGERERNSLSARGMERETGISNAINQTFMWWIKSLSSC